MRKQLIPFWPLIATLLANLLLFSLVPGLVRYAAALFLLLVLPGWVWSFSVTRFIPRLVTAVGLSLALTIFGSMAAVYMPGPLATSQVLVIINLMIVTGWFVGYRRSRDVQIISGGSQASIALILLLIVSAMVLRVVRLGYAEFHEDEAEALMLGVRLLQGEDYALFLHRKGPAQMLVPVGLWLLTGQITETMARLPFALASVSSVLAVFLIARRWYGTGAALTAALLWMVNGYGIAFGRMAQYQALIFFLGPLALYLLLLAADQRRISLQILAAILLATSLLAHFDALLLLPAAGYLFVISYQATANGHGRRRANFGLGISLGLFFLLLASFYIPFVLDPEFKNTTTYLAESRVKPGFLYNNLDVLRRFDRDYSSHFYLLLLAIGLVGFHFLENRDGSIRRSDPDQSEGSKALLKAISVAQRQYTIVSILLLILVATTFWLPNVWQIGSVSLAIVPWLLLGGLSMLVAYRTETKAALLVFGVPFVGYVFLVDDPRTHLYILYPGAVLLAGAGWIAARSWATRKNTNAGHVLIALGLLAMMAVAVYEVAIFLQTESTFSQLRTGWDGSLWETVYDDIPKPREYFGYPKREGWKAIGTLRADGQYPGDFRSVNEEFIIPIWYNFGEPRSCYDTPSQFFVRLTDLEDPINKTGYQPSGSVTREGETRLEISSRINLVPELVSSYAVEDLVDTFDQLATPARFAGNTLPSQVVGAQFGNLIELVGFELPATTVQPGDTLYLDLHWLAVAEPGLDYRVFVHLTDGKTLWAQQDDNPACRLPTSVWRRGQRSLGQFRLPVKPETPPGRYPLIIGLYRADTLERLRITSGNAGAIGDDFLWIGDIEVR